MIVNIFSTVINFVESIMWIVELGFAIFGAWSLFAIISAKDEQPAQPIAQVTENVWTEDIDVPAFMKN